MMRQSRNSRGAAVIEGMIVAPVLFLIVFGFIEYSSFLRKTMDVRNAAEAGAREARIAASQTNADYLVLQKVKGALGVSQGTARVQCVIIFHANHRNDTVNGNGCTDSVCPITSECNVYTKTQLEGLGTTVPESSFGLPNGPDHKWPGAVRDNTLYCGTDLIGVYVQSSVKSVTGLFPLPSLNKGTKVTLIEPVYDRSTADEAAAGSC